MTLLSLSIVLIILRNDSQACWGKMSVDQMLAHCSVVYEMVYDNVHQKTNAFLRFILKSFIKDKVENENPYSRNIRTARQFIISNKHDFEIEKSKLINYINKTQELGEKEFEGKESMSFGKLNSKEWNNMFAKHLDHHLYKFNV